MRTLDLVFAIILILLFGSLFIGLLSIFEFSRSIT